MKWVNIDVVRIVLSHSMVNVGFRQINNHDEFEHKILLDDYKVRPELNKHKNI